MKVTEFTDIPQEKFRLNTDMDRFHDAKLDTKPVGYFRDALKRFKKNKASVVATAIILFIVVFALIVPILSPYEISFSDTVYSKLVPKNKFLANFGFCDGQKVMECNDRLYANVVGVGIGAADTDGSGATYAEGLKNPYNAAINIGEAYESEGRTYRNISVDMYYYVGFKYMQVTPDVYDELVAWQKETGKQIIYPMVDTHNEYCYDDSNANYWYKTKPGRMDPINIVDGNQVVVNVEKANLEDNYLRDKDGNVRYYENVGQNARRIRVLYYNYYQYENGREPYYLFGTDTNGYDICTRLASGIRLSLMLAIAVSVINLTIGTVYGAIEGYFGGAADLIMERVSDILSGVPFIVVATLFQLHMSNKVGPVVSFLFAFVLTGWLGTAYRVRTQFYRFKNSEYVYAARTLGASDARLMFKHIFPNSLGTIITSSVLVIPGVILSESMLSYLGIINITGDKTASIGAMLSSAQATFTQYPHMIFFPALVISLLEISFNLFGNGLRDAFNPSLRGVED